MAHNAVNGSAIECLSAWKMQRRGAREKLAQVQPGHDRQAQRKAACEAVRRVGCQSADVLSFIGERHAARGHPSMELRRISW